jgi:photosynthetic reaction center M subunit
MATILIPPTDQLPGPVERPMPHVELPEPSPMDGADFIGVRLGKPLRIRLLADLKVDTQFGTIYLGAWGFLSVITFVAGMFVLLYAGIQQMNGDVWDFVKYFANVQILPPDRLGFAPSLKGGGFWELQTFLWGISILAWAGRCWERTRRHKWRPFILFGFLAAILLTFTIWLYRPIAMGTWAEAPGYGLNSDLDWAQNFSVLWGNLYWNPWHMLAIFFLFGSVLLWGMHGATILATSSEGSHHEDFEIKDMHSGSHKSMLFWRWTMGFNANPKTIHDWLYWFSAGVVLSSALGIFVTGTVVQDWYVWGVDHGWVAQYGPMTRSAVNGRPQIMPDIMTSPYTPGENIPAPANP